MKTVPTLRLVSKPEAPAELDGLGVDDLPAEVRLALTDIAGAAREGLLAMSVAAGMAVMRAMFDAEITAVCGPRGKHDPDRAAVRHGAGRGSVVLGGRRVPVTRPRARTVNGGEVPLVAYRLFAAEDQLTAVVMERMLAGLATRRHVAAAEPVGAGVQKQATATSRSAVSRRFIAATKTALADLLARDLTPLNIKVLMVDGEHLAEHLAVVALAITADGTKVPVGLWEGSTENATVVKALLADLVARGLDATNGFAGCHRRREGSVGGGEGRFRCQRCGPAVHCPQETKRCRPPARGRTRLGRHQTRQDLRQPRSRRRATRGQGPPPACGRAWRTCSPSPGWASPAPWPAR